MNFKRNSIIVNLKVLIGIGLLMLSGCSSYHVGSIAHPHIKSIAIAPVINETYSPNASAYMKQALAEAFQKDGSYKVVQTEEADCVMYGRIINIVLSAPDITVAKGDVNYFTNQFGMTLTYEFTVIVPGTPKPLIPTTQVSASIQYQVPVDYGVSMQEALRDACYQTALDAVIATTEAW